jgi:ABC-type antimicrobial peptide transport system permease subunit
VLGKVAHIPTITDSTAGQLSDSPPPPGGILLDYQTYLNYYQKLSSDSNLNRPLNINQLWFRTTDDESVLKTLRSELEKYSHDSFDRRAIKQSLDVDPLNLNMLGILTLGAITALLLATVGDLIASVLGIRPRLTNFAVLRALGTAPRQLASIIGWEQGFIYILAICIGLLCGSLLTFTIVPNLIHMSFPRVGILSSLSPGDFYALQQIIPGTPVLSPLLLIALGLLVLTFAVALWLMLRTVAKPSMSQVLRLNQD